MLAKRVSRIDGEERFIRSNTLDDGAVRRQTNSIVSGQNVLRVFQADINSMVVRALTTMTVKESKDYLRELCLDGVLEKNPEEKRRAGYGLAE